MDILLGTTNPSKAEWFSRLLAGYDVHFLTLHDLGIDKIPDEDGMTPVENAMRKAAWYGRYFDHVLTNDSGLYLRALPMDDPRQPGLFVRRATDGHPMGDEEMIAHYSALAQSLGGECLASYYSAYCVFRKGEMFSYADDEETRNLFAFRLVSQPHPDRHPGWPLDSLSVDIHTGRYFVEEPTRTDRAGDPAVTAGKRRANERLRRFLAQSFLLV